MTMSFKRSVIVTLFCHELRLVLRDRRAMFTSIVLPLLVMPLLLFGSHWTFKKREQRLQSTIYHLAVTGSQAASARALLDAIQQHRPADDRAKGKTIFKFDVLSPTNAPVALAKGDLHAILEGLAPGETRPSEIDGRSNNATNSSMLKQPVEIRNGDEEAEPALAVEAGVLVIRILFRADRDDSVAGMRNVRDALLETRQAQRVALLKSHGFPLSPAQVATVAEINVATQGQVAGLALGRLVTLLLLFFILVGGAVVATDLLAGEKERGTLETLLTSGASRVEIITAKHLVICAVALTITLIQAANLLVYVGFKFIPVPANFAAAVPPFTALLLLVLYLPVAALAASVLLMTSGYAKSYKEAQLYFFPVLLLGLLPALSPFLPGLPLRSAIVLVPVANLALAAKEILVGSFDWPMIVLSWLVTVTVALWTIYLTVRFLSAEKLITASDTDAIDLAGGPELFGRHVPRWFALLWAILLIVNNYSAKADLRVQVLINLVGLFFGASVLMIWRYRLDPRAALALRLPKPIVWPAVLMAVPSGLLTGYGLFRLANLFFPIPSKLLEEFSENLVPSGISSVQLFFFLAVLPGIFEELAFRGVLLHGLHHRLRPLPLVLTVGLLFGFFHMALFRLAPTAWLGILLAAVTLLSGSIFPAMLWHTLNNTIGIVAFKQQIPLADLDLPTYLIGAIGLAGAFWIFWRHRTPYPGLLPWRR